MTILILVMDLGNDRARSSNYYRTITQLVEYTTDNRDVVGSNPTCSTIFLGNTVITFYPNTDLELWKGVFKVGPEPITAIDHGDRYYGHYRNRAEFVEFLQEHNVNIELSSFPLNIFKLEHPHHVYTDATHIVTRLEVLGYIKDDLC